MTAVAGRRFCGRCRLFYPAALEPDRLSRISAIWFCDGFIRAGMMLRMGSDVNVNSVSILIGVGRVLSSTPA